MKKTKGLLLGLLALGLGFTSCDDDEEVKLANLSVTVESSTDFSSIDISDVYVFVMNTGDEAKDSAMVDADGIAVFENLAPGTYNVSATKALTAEESGEASGYYEEITLNATKADVELFGGIDAVETITLDGKPSSSLIISEFYYSGASDPTYGVGFKDQYVKIYNNSSDVVYADGLYLASIVPQRNGSNKDDDLSTLDNTEFVYADKVTQIPGSGEENPIQPGESIVVAFSGLDWTDGGTKDFSVDLSGADFEMYAITWLESLGRIGNTFFDNDNADVPNMNPIYLNIENYGFFTFSSTGASIAILRCDETPTETIVDPESSETTPINYLKLPVSSVIDGIDMLYDAESAAYKKFPATIDAGFGFVEGPSYTSLKVRRKEAKTVDGRVIYKDTNNSTEDFESVHVTE